MDPLTLRRRQLWITLAFVILLVLISFSVVAIVDGITHPSSLSATPTSIERTPTP